MIPTWEVSVLQKRNAELRAPGYFLMDNKPTCSLFWKMLVLFSKAVYTNIPDTIVENKRQSMPLLTRCVKLRHSLTIILQLIFLWTFSVDIHKELIHTFPIRNQNDLILLVLHLYFLYPMPHIPVSTDNIIIHFSYPMQGNNTQNKNTNTSIENMITITVEKLFLYLRVYT